MTTTIVLPTNPVDIKAIKDAMREISDCYLRMDSEKEQVKEIIAVIEEKYELPKKFITKMARVYHKSTFDKDVAESDDFQALYETIMR